MIFASATPCTRQQWRLQSASAIRPRTTGPCVRYARPTVSLSTFQTARSSRRKQLWTHRESVRAGQRGERRWCARAGLARHCPARRHGRRRADRSHSEGFRHPAEVSSRYRAASRARQSATRDRRRPWRCGACARDSANQQMTVDAHTASVRVPGTSANLGAGFDCIGMAVDRWLTASVEADDNGGFRWRGDHDPPRRAAWRRWRYRRKTTRSTWDSSPPARPLIARSPNASLFCRLRDTGRARARIFIRRIGSRSAPRRRST